jgi:Flp pilus assembly protein TadD
VVRGWLVAWCAVAFATSCPIASAQVEPTDDERAAFARATELYERGEFVAAASAFTELAERHGSPELHFNAYRAHLEAGHPRDAARHLRAYLDNAPAEDRTDALRQQLAELERREADEPEPTRAEPSSPEPSVRTSGPPVTGIVLAASGGLLLAGALVTGLVALGEKGELDASCVERVCDPSLRSTGDALLGLAVATDVMLGVGVALLAVGVVLIVVGSGGGAGEELERAMRGRPWAFSF